MKFKSLLTVLPLLALTACVQPTAYVPAGDSGNGYSDQRLANNRFRITFTGNSATKRAAVENFLLLRAAEVTRDAGYDWFVFDTRDTKAKTTYHTDSDPFPGWWGPGYGWYWRNWDYDPWDPHWQSTSFPSTRYEAYAEIILLTPDQAKLDAHALQASDVIARLTPKVASPAGAP